MQRANGVFLTLMQDRAPGHKAAGTLEDMDEQGIEAVEWPPYSPDLNPIKTV